MIENILWNVYNGFLKSFVCCLLIIIFELLVKCCIFNFCLFESFKLFIYLWIIFDNVVFFLLFFLDIFFLKLVCWVVLYWNNFVIIGLLFFIFGINWFFLFKLIIL